MHNHYRERCEEEEKMQKQEQEAVEGIKREHQHPRTIGFEPVPVVKAAGSATRYRVTPGRLAAAVSKALAARALNADRLEYEGAPGTVLPAIEAELARRRQAGAARKSGTGNEAVDLERMWRGGDDGTLRKSAGE